MLGRRHPADLGVILALVCGAQLMVVLDLVVVNVALPSIQRDPGLGQPELQWVVIAYGLTFGGFLVLGGRAADLRRLGAGWTLVVGQGLSGVATQVVAFTGVKENVSGLAGGMISTAQEFGAAVGLAIIATAAAAHSANADLLRVALADGFRRGTMVGAGFSIAAALIAAALLLRPPEPSAASPAMDESTPEPDLRAA
jgi:MFS family permease